MSERAHKLWLAMCRATDPAEERKLRRQFIVAARADERREARQRPRDEAREVQAQAAACLIEALGEMRPYLPEDA